MNVVALSERSYTGESVCWPFCVNEGVRMALFDSIIVGKAFETAGETYSWLFYDLFRVLSISVAWHGLH